MYCACYVVVVTALDRVFYFLGRLNENFCLDCGLLFELHALTQATCSYVLLVCACMGA